MRIPIAILIFAVAATAAAALRQEVDPGVQQARAELRHSDARKAGNGSVARATFGAGSAIDTGTVAQPIIGFVHSNGDLLYKMSFGGSKRIGVAR